VLIFCACPLNGLLRIRTFASRKNGRAQYTSNFSTPSYSSYFSLYISRYFLLSLFLMRDLHFVRLIWMRGRQMLIGEKKVSKVKGMVQMGGRKLVIVAALSCSMLIT